MFLAGAIVVGAALVTEILFQPPYWVHAALWLPLILLVTLGPLRPMKGLMIALQFHHKAAESRFGQENSQERRQQYDQDHDREYDQEHR